LIKPETEEALAEIIKGASAPLLVQGNATKASMLRPVQAGETLSTAGLTGITLYAPNELVMSARAGTTLAEIETTLAAQGQMMIAEPSQFFGPHQTIGGIVGANISGPRRVTGGAMRDHVLGVRAVNGAGETLRFGGRVLKNVTGLDVAKFLTGSFGTLAVMSEITFKVLPRAEATGTVVVENIDAAEGLAVMTAGLGSPYSVSGAAYLPATRQAVLRVEEFAESVAYRTAKLAAPFAGAHVLGTAASLALWADIRDAAMLPAGEAVWRVSMPPSAAPALLAALAPAGVAGFLDWGGGLAWLTGPASQAAHEAVCAAARAANGAWWLVRGPESLRAAVQTLPPESPALAAMRRRVAAAFDPRGILNPLKLRAA
jgi:glycolate oxidase FAD binding subunit